MQLMSLFTQTTARRRPSQSPTVMESLPSGAMGVTTAATEMDGRSHSRGLVPKFMECQNTYVRWPAALQAAAEKIR
jgi:hypothetical protein